MCYCVPITLGVVFTFDVSNGGGGVREGDVSVLDMNINIHDVYGECAFI